MSSDIDINAFCEALQRNYNACDVQHTLMTGASHSYAEHSLPGI